MFTLWIGRGKKGLIKWDDLMNAVKTIWLISEEMVV